MSQEFKRQAARSEKNCPKREALVDELVASAELEQAEEGVSGWNEDYIKWKKPKKKSSSGPIKK